MSEQVAGCKKCPFHKPARERWTMRLTDVCTEGKFEIDKPETYAQWKGGFIDPRCPLPKQSQKGTE